MAKILTIITIIILAGIGILTLISNKIRIYKASAEGKDYALTTEIDWLKSLKHTVIMYLVPVLILTLPFLGDQKPTIQDVFQATAAYLAIYYLKIIYWK